VLQAFSWSQYDPSYADRFPTRAEMQTMRDMAMGVGDPQMMLWYTFNDVMDSSDPAGNWEDVKTAAFAPYVRVTGLSSRRCVKKLKARISVRANSAIRKVRARLDGHSVLQTQREHASCRPCGSPRGVTSSASPRPTARVRARSSRSGSAAALAPGRDHPPGRDPL
jgi:hypothetical protein